jgi:two-component sensor histidine kinase
LSEARRILYVDDDAALRRLVQRALARRGFAVEVAGSVDEGLARLREGGFDLIAVDHYMPGRDGLSLLRELAKDSAAPPVVYVTGTDETQVAVTALKSGAADYVVKSVGEEFFDLLARSFDQALAKVALERAKTEAEQALREANLRLEALLGEVHHRVANSLQMVSVFVSMQAAQTSDDTCRAALEETIGRIQAISQVHRKLYTSKQTDRIALDEYLETLVTDLEASVSNIGERITVALEAEPVIVTPDAAVSIGVIVSELVNNAAKYAFDPGHIGEIAVILRREDGAAYTIEVRDDGCGFDGSEEARGTGLGMRIVGAMARSLKSELRKLNSQNGACFALTVPG